MKLSLAVACLALGGVLSGCGGGNANTEGTLSSGAVASLQWVTPAPLFTANGQQHTLQVQALDASGNVLNVPIAWQSNAPTVVAVGGGGTSGTATLTAQAASGQALLTASAGGRSITAVAVVAAPALGAMVLSDAQVDDQPQPTGATLASGALRLGSTYTVRLQTGVAPPAVGSLVLGQGSKAVAGEVVAVDGQLITLAMVPLDRLLPGLVLDVDVPLTAFATGGTTRSAGAAAGGASTKAQAQAETSFGLAGFECDAEGSVGGVELAKKDVAPLGLDSLRYRVLWNSNRKMLRLSGQPGVQFELEPTASLAFTGKVDCQLELADIPIPLPPTIGLFLGVGFPVGVGFTLEGALPVNGVALNLKGQAQADVVVGFDCAPRCASLNSITPSGSVTPAITAPDFTANRLDLSGQVYAWANFEGGARWSSTLQFDAIEAQAGLKFASTLGTENAQARDAASAGQYALTFEASAAPTEALGDMADLVGLILDAANLETSVPLGRSPRGVLAADKTSFKAGDDVRFQVDLTSDDVLFPLQGYNVQSVRIYRKTVADDGSYVLVLANEQRASNGQTQFTIPWLATVDSGSSISFVAFVQTRLLSGLRWQVGLVQAQEPANKLATRIAAGDVFTCALNSAGLAKCWGYPLGLRGSAGNAALSGTPTDVAGLGIARSITAGAIHACAITQADGVKCWGLNDGGVLGNGGSADSRSPVDVAGLDSGVAALDAGRYHTCVVTIAGAVKCWGSNFSGQMGNGFSGSFSATPLDVAGLGSGVAAVSAGDQHSCALTSAGGVRCWGGNTFGQLGDGNRVDSQPTPVNVSGLGQGVKAIAVGRNHTCALSNAGAVSCWGSGSFGQLGNGTSGTVSTRPAAVPGLSSGVASIVAGMDHTCALFETGSVRCWGRGTDGQLGNGGLAHSSVPVEITALGMNALEIAPGHSQTCAFIRGGGLKCWGNNFDGQLGIGSVGNSENGVMESPVPVDVIGFP